MDAEMKSTDAIHTGLDCSISTIWVKSTGRKRKPKMTAMTAMTSGEKSTNSTRSNAIIKDGFNAKLIGCSPNTTV
jgi:hypothetical protein